MTLLKIAFQVDYVQELGRRLLDKNPRLREVDAQLKHLGSEMNAVKVGIAIRPLLLQ